MKKKKSRFYRVEMPTETTKLIAEVCDAYGNILAGDVNVLRDIVTEAYQRRIGRGVPAEVEARIQELSRELISIGWDTSTHTGYAHRFSKDCDTLFDVAEVLQNELAKHGDIDEQPIEPLHWNEDVELCRVLQVTTSRQRRTKQNID